MSQRSIFYEEWRRCLQEQYKYVVRSRDEKTRESLTGVLYNFGFTDDELADLYRQATMRAEDLPDDFVPDQRQAAADLTFEPHPAECTCALCSPEMAEVDAALEAGHDEEGQPLPPSEPGDEAAETDPDADTDSDANPRQMNLF